MVNRFDVYLVNLDTQVSKDPKNTRPCVVISPDELNRNISNVIIAPLSSAAAKYPTRIPVYFLNRDRSIVLDQLRTVDKVRLVKKIGEIEESIQKVTLDRLKELFAD